MASTSFLNLTNKLLRRLNEVEISQSDFASARGVQAMAKDAINASIQEILQSENKWPFKASASTQLLVVGQEEYDWPADLVLPEWDSFLVVKDDDLGVSGHPIEYVSRDWYMKYRKSDDDYSGSDGISVPYYVSPAHGSGYVISPSPDQAYTISFDYWTGVTGLTLYNDTSSIPSGYDEVIIQGAIYHFYLFRDNPGHAQMAEVKFKRLLQGMRTILINNEDRIRSGMIPRTNRLLTFAEKIE